MGHEHSAQQLAIFDAFKNANGKYKNVLVRARAGTGKTYTIVEGISYAPDARILLAAFNKKIAMELTSRIKNPNAEAATLHSVGFGLVRRYWDRVRIDDKGDRAMDLAYKACGQQAPDALLRLVAKAHTKAREIVPHAVNKGDLLSLIFEHDLLPDDEWTADGFDEHWVEAHALKAMKFAEEKPVNGIDFADMIFLPLRNKWCRPKYDLVVIDEAQDMTDAQLELAMGVCKDRVFVVGDDRQAIYGFRGADSNSLDRLKTKLEAIELGLTMTYRCGMAIVERAAKIVPDFEAAPANPLGEIKGCEYSQIATLAMPDDFILSRKNAPLVSTAMMLLRAGKRCKIEGRDIGAGLKAIVKKLATGKARNSLPEWLGKLKTWEEKEALRAEKADQPAKADRVHDQADTLRALAEGLSGLRELEARIDDLFSDGPGRDFIVCSSIHKSKGLERDRVFVLADTFRRPKAEGSFGGNGGGKKFKPMTPAQIREEQNLEYVAITRAKLTLFWVSGLPGRE